MENIMFCSKCGQRNSLESKFCAKCGSQINHINQNENINREESINTNNNTYQSQGNSYVASENRIEYDDEYLKDMDLFIEKNQVFYFEKFNKIIKTGDKKTWNWSAFLIPFYWLLYRKMYIQAAVICLASATLACIPYMGSILNLGLLIAFGVFANSIYLDHINKKLTEINILNQGNKEFMISKKGGTNIVIPVCFIVIPLIIFIIIAIMFFTVFSSMFYMW